MCKAAHLDAIVQEIGPQLSVILAHRNGSLNLQALVAAAKLFPATMTRLAGFLQSPSAFVQLVTLHLGHFVVHLLSRNEMPLNTGQTYH